MKSWITSVSIPLRMLIQSVNEIYHKVFSYKVFFNIYNGIIFPSLSPAKKILFTFRWTQWTKSSAVWPNHLRSNFKNTSNEVQCPLLWGFWIYNFSRRILERFFVGSIVNIRNGCLLSGFMGFGVQGICLSCATIHSPWTRKKRHSFLN